MSAVADRRARWGRCLLHASLAMLCAACASQPAFGTKFPDNRESDIEYLLARMRSASPRPQTRFAVAVSSEPKRLYAFDLSARTLSWQTAVDATSSPFLAGDTVVVQAGEDVVGYELSSGERLFRVGVGDMTLKGADGEAGRIAFVVGSGQGTFARSQALLIKGTTLAWRRDIESQAGSPAVVGDTVLVPWSTQYLSGVDAATGNEIARIRVRDGVISHSMRAGDQVIIGSYHGLSRVSDRLASGSLQDPGFFSLPEGDLPGRPLMLPDLYMSPKVQAPASAQHRIGLAFHANASGQAPIALRDDTLYLYFYRLVFALDPRSYDVRWTHSHDADIVGAAAEQGGLLLADETGAFTALGAASGQVLWQAKTGVASTVARIPRDGAQLDPGSPPSEPTVRAQLLGAAQDTDARLVPARLYAVQQLSAMKDAEATANLITLCDDERLAPQVRTQACTALRGRTLGEEHLLAALERHAAYLKGTSTPPVGALAKAAASQKVKSAVPLLVAHLGDPNTPSRDLPALVTALRELEDPAAAEPLSSFLQLYHADPIDEHLVRALELIPAALVALTGPVAQPALRDVADDELANAAVRQRALSALQTIEAMEVAAKQQERKQAQANKEQLEAEVAEPDPVDKVPSRLSTSVVDKALLPVRDELQACLVAGEEPVFHARVVLVVEDGKVLMVSVLPKKLQGCVEPLVRSQEFPKTLVAKREQISYVLKRK